MDDGNAWEDLCVRCYRLRYQKEHYALVPAVQGGDGGIEGFTMSGVVHQRNKMTADIKKLMSSKNALKLKALGVPKISEWHFNIPEYKDAATCSCRSEAARSFGC